MADGQGEAAWGPEGEAVVIYCEPLATLEMRHPRQVMRISVIYTVEDRTPRVYPWMNESGGGIMPSWNI